MRSQADAILASDFFTADLLDGTQAYVLAVIEHASRRIRILGVTPHPTGEWTAQQARNLLMDLGEQAHWVKFMIRDRGSNFTAAFDAVLADAGIRNVLCNVATPRMNAIAERWIGGCRRELLDRTLIWNQAHLRRILREYETYQPGSPGALLHRGPLRTGHARSRAPRPRQAAKGGSGRLLHHGVSRRPGLVFAPVAGGVYEVCSVVACGAGRVVADQVVRLDRLPGDPQEPVFPALGGLGLVGGQQVLPAGAAPPVLPGQQAYGIGIQRGCHLLATLRPVPGQGGVIGGRPAFDQGMPHDIGPGPMALS